MHPTLRVIMSIRSLSLIVAASSVFAAFLSPVSASAETLHFSAQLSSATEVPPHQTNGTGMVKATYNTTSKALHYDITYKGLTGPATAAHFHGPAMEGQNAPPVVPIKPTDLASPIKGEATLTAAQAADLTAGKWYFNVHTAANPGGEIRGQLAAAK